MNRTDDQSERGIDSIHVSQDSVQNTRMFLNVPPIIRFPSVGSINNTSKPRSSSHDIFSLELSTDLTVMNKSEKYHISTQTLHEQDLLI